MHRPRLILAEGSEIRLGDVLAHFGTAVRVSLDPTHCEGFTAQPSKTAA